MRTDTGHVFRLEDYRPSDYLIRKTDLHFTLEPEQTIIRSRLTMERRDGVASSAPLILDGDELSLQNLTVNQLIVNDYDVTPELLTIRNLPPEQSFTVEITTVINPSSNKQLMGLYRSNNIYTTQCEAEGFRRITYFLDRPDVLSVYTVHIDAEQSSCPVLLSNGNLFESGSSDTGRHYAKWHDPHPKPSYLFALVAGSLGSISDQFTTRSGREVALNIYVEHGNESRAHYAMDALKRSMLWDEQKFGCEYDLDIFNIVAVSDFNMGAMENKGLNIFNDKYVLADPQTATDEDYAGIETVIAHEYFHNWTGNRITCRDWFQLCLKEGLTVYRDHEFSSNQRSRAVHRIDEVKTLKAQQFPEDSGPLAHPVRPREYREINNFYTATVYEKGSELVRMLRLIIGETAFHQGMALYFERHDGDAATIEDLLNVFAESSGQDLSQFALWYEQAGTPLVTATSHYDADAQTLHLSLQQSLAPTPGQNDKQPMHIPLRFGLIGSDGRDLSLDRYQSGDGQSEISGDVLHLKQASQSYQFDHLSERPVLSLLRDFSAPVQLQHNISHDDQLFLARFDQDAFGRWQAITHLMTAAMIKDIQTSHTDARTPRFEPQLAQQIADLAKDETLDHAFRALCLSLPEEADIARELGKNIDPDHIHQSHRALSAVIAKGNADLFAGLIDRLHDDNAFSPDATSAGKRKLKSVLLHYLSIAENAPDRAFALYQAANNMSDRIAALRPLVNLFAQSPQTLDALADYEQRFAKIPLAMDKWFALQARSPQTHILQTVQHLMLHPLFAFDNPNRCRALLGSFSSGNPTGFNRPDGSAYRFFTAQILQIDRDNPQLASRLLTALRSWRTLEPIRRDHLHQALQDIAASAELSTDVRDIAERMLA